MLFSLYVDNVHKSDNFNVKKTCRKSDFEQMSQIIERNIERERERTEWEIEI